MAEGCTGRVVAAYDGSDPSRAAVAWAAAEAGRRGAGLTLLHAVVPPVTYSSFGPSLPPPVDIVRDLEREARHELDELAAGLDVPKGVVSHVEVGSPSGVLIDASTDAALLVMGSRGRGGFSGLLLGSVGDQVTGHARCPVVVVRAAPAPGARLVVAGVDGSDAGKAALRFAFETAQRDGWPLRAVHAWDVPSYDIVSAPGFETAMELHDRDAAEVSLAADVLAPLRAAFPDVAVEERVVRGGAAIQLIANAEDAGLLVVGTRGRGQLAGAVLGSVSRAVLHRAHVPVAVVPGERP